MEGSELSLNERTTAVNQQNHARQKDASSLHEKASFLRFPSSALYDEVECDHDVIISFFEKNLTLTGQRVISVTRIEEVDADATRPPLSGKRTHQHVHSALCGAISREPFKCNN